MDCSGNGDSAEELRTTLMEMALESWRFSRLFARLMTKVDAGEAARYASQLRYFGKRLEDCMDVAGLRFVSLEGQPYDPGMAASPLNIADFSPDEPLVVDQMVEPVLMGRDGLEKTGTVMLRRAE